VGFGGFDFNTGDEPGPQGNDLTEMAAMYSGTPVILNLEADKEYTMSGPINSPSLIINGVEGANAKIKMASGSYFSPKSDLILKNVDIDAAATSEPLIKLNETPIESSINAEGGYYIIENIEISNSNLSNVSQIINDNNVKYCVHNMLVDNCVVSLNASSKKIAEGRYDEVIPHTQREDAVGQLQNSFATMTEALVEHVDSIRQTTEETKQSNEELVHAMEMAREAVRQKTEFIQNVSHQIRTPLNIIQGFAQVLNSGETLPEEERKTVTTTMKHNAVHLNRMVLMLFDSSDTGSEEELKKIRDDKVFCNAIATECISLTTARFPDQTISFETEVPNSLQIVTSHLYLSRSLLELLYNALKYSDGEHVKLRVTQTEKTVCFTVEDRGMGMPEEWQEKLYKPFVKVNSLSEGLGLGLSLTMRHAIRLGGTLKLDTTYHDGCRFTMEMPK
jgi:signal transduction histidine kinase